MPAAAVNLPAETDVLCEGCGYVLNGLPFGEAASSRCPECGKPTAESASTLRQPPAWERVEAGRGLLSRFLDTTLAVLIQPRRFFRTSTTRPPARSTGSVSSLRFAQIHWALASVLFGIAAASHFTWSVYLGTRGQEWDQTRTWWLVAAGGVIGAYAFLMLLTRLAARLTTWEATYRGIRLPLPVVLRGLHYHTPHYLPVALITVVTVVGYQALLRQYFILGEYGMTYLAVLCVEVVAAAFYLFKTYWTAMRNIMYANA